MKAVALIIFALLYSLSNVGQSVQPDSPKSRTGYANIYIKKEKITSITYDRRGGRGGSFTTLTITLALVKLQTRRLSDSVVINNKRNSTKAWNKLLRSFNLKKFDAVKSGESRQTYDGVDVTVSILTNVGTHYLLNGDADQQHYTKIAGFVTQLEQQVDKFNK